MSLRCFTSTNHPKCLNQSSHMIATGKLVNRKTQRNVRRKPRSEICWWPVGEYEAWCLSVSRAGKTLTSAPVSMRNRVPECLSVTNSLASKFPSVCGLGLYVGGAATAETTVGSGGAPASRPATRSLAQLTSESLNLGCKLFNSCLEGLIEWMRLQYGLARGEEQQPWLWRSRAPIPLLFCPQCQRAVQFWSCRVRRNNWDGLRSASSSEMSNWWSRSEVSALDQLGFEVGVALGLWRRN